VSKTSYAKLTAWTVEREVPVIKDRVTARDAETKADSLMSLLFIAKFISNNFPSDSNVYPCLFTCALAFYIGTPCMRANQDSANQDSFDPWHRIADRSLQHSFKPVGSIGV